MEVTIVLYVFTSQVLLFPSKLICLQLTHHAMSRVLRTCKESKEEMLGKQGGHVWASNVMLNDSTDEATLTKHRL